MQVGQYGQLIYRELRQALGASQLHRRGRPGEFPFPRTQKTVASLKDVQKENLMSLFANPLCIPGNSFNLNLTWSIETDIFFFSSWRVGISGECSYIDFEGHY